MAASAPCLQVAAASSSYCHQAEFQRRLRGFVDALPTRCYSSVPLSISCCSSDPPSYTSRVNEVLHPSLHPSLELSSIRRAALDSHLTAPSQSEDSFAVCDAAEDTVARADALQEEVSSELSKRVTRFGPSFLLGTAVALTLAFGLPRAAQAKGEKAIPPPPTPIVGKQSAGGGMAPSDPSAEQAKAVKMLEDFLAKHPNDVTALRMLLRVRMKAADFAGGIALLNQLIELEPLDLEWRYIRAQTLEFVGDVQAARKGFNDILQVDPFSARALQGLATVMRRSGEDSLVLGMVEEAVQRATSASKHQEATNLKMLLGQLHALQGDLPSALSHYDAIIASDPSDFRPYLCKGLVFSLSGESDKAEEQFTEFRRRCPKNYAAYLDNMLVKSTVEARRQEREKRQQTESQGRKGRPMQQPTSGSDLVNAP